MDCVFISHMVIIIIIGWISLYNLDLFHELTHLIVDHDQSLLYTHKTSKFYHITHRFEAFWLHYAQCKEILKQICENQHTRLSMFQLNTKCKLVIQSPHNWNRQNVRDLPQ